MGWVLLYFIFLIIFVSAFALYHIPVQAAAYPLSLCGIIGLVLVVCGYIRDCRKYKILMELKSREGELMNGFPKPSDGIEEAYQEIIEKLRREEADLIAMMSRRYNDMTDYYTTWVHQVKTPIAAIRLMLQNEDTDLSRKLTEEIVRIEQYVDMVLCYLRLDFETTDYVFGTYSLDDIVRQAVRKLSGQFINRGIRLCYEPLGVDVLTDEKWLLFVIEQVLSNAIKYIGPVSKGTKSASGSGSISIYLEEPKTLCIRDTGIGIATEDLPRIFEKGYTGCNGRSDKRASGIGLYLCSRICKNLNHTISADSVPDKGSVIRIGLDRRDIDVE